MELNNNYSFLKLQYFVLTKKMTKRSRDEYIEIEDQILKHVSEEKYKVKPYYLTNPDPNSKQKTIQYTPKMVYSLQEARTVRDKIIELRKNDPNNRQQSKNRVDERKETYPGETDMVTLLPCSTITQVFKRTRRNKTQLSWYEGSRYQEMNVDGWSNEEIDNKVSDIKENKCNKITDAITIPRSHIDATHMKYYRYKQACVEYQEQTVPIDPYFFGVWLGDGTSKNVSLTSMDKQVIQYWCDYAKENHLQIRIDQYKERVSDALSEENEFTATYHIHGEKGTHNTILKCFQELNLINNKHIPRLFKENSMKTRLELLAGIIDTDGSRENNKGYEIQQVNKVLANDIYELCQSLGFTTSIVDVMKCATNTEAKVKNTYKRINISIYQHSPEIPCKIERKQINPSSITQYHNHPIDSNGNKADKRVRNSWNEENTKLLIAMIKQQPQRKNWTFIKNSNELLNCFSNDALRTKYRELVDKGIIQ